MCRMFKIRFPESIGDPDRVAAAAAAHRAIANAIESRMRKAGTAVFELLSEPLPRATTGIEIRCTDSGTQGTELVAEAVEDAVKAMYAALGNRFSVRGCIAGCDSPILELKGASVAA